MFMIFKELVKSRIEFVLYVLKFLPQQFLLPPWDKPRDLYAWLSSLFCDKFPKAKRAIYAALSCLHVIF